MLCYHVTKKKHFMTDYLMFSKFQINYELECPNLVLLECPKSVPRMELNIMHYI